MVAEALGRRALSEASSAADADASARPELSAVYEAHFRYVWRCLRSLGVHADHVDDALQDVFIVVARRLPEFDGRAELGTWLYAIALRIARKYRERRAREASSLAASDDESSPTQAQGATGERAALHGERLALARAILETLSDEQREVFVLARVEQMSAPEIASVLGVPLNTVYSRLRAARLAFEAEAARRQASNRNLP